MPSINKIKEGSAPLNSKNIDVLIKSIRNQIDKDVSLQPPMGLLFPRTIRGDLDRKRYRGVGRPRKDDYKRINTMSFLRKLPSSLGFSLEGDKK